MCLPLEIQEYILKLARQQELRDAKNNVLKQKLHQELNLYFQCYYAWNSPTYEGLIKVYRHKVTAVYYDLSKQKHEFWLGTSLPSAVSYCKNHKLWRQSLPPVRFCLL